MAQIALHRLHLSAAEEHLPRISFVVAPADTVLVLLPIDGGPSPIWGGIATRADEILTLAPDQRVHSRTDGPCRWGTMRLPARDLSQYVTAMSGAEFVVPDMVARWRPPPAARKELRQLHQAATRTAETRPTILIDDETARGLEQQLIGALVKCLSSGQIDGAAAAQRHRDILSRFEGLLDTQPVLRIAEICAILGVSDRMLRICCRRESGGEPEQLPPLSPHATRAPRAAERQSRRRKRRRSRRAIRSRQSRPVCRELPSALWGIAIRHLAAEPPARARDGPRGR